MQRIWQPLLLTGTLTPLLTAFTYPEEGMTVALACFMAALLAFALEHEPHVAGPARPGQAALWIILLAAFLVTGWVDVITGFSIDVALLYYIPIALAAWRLPLTGSAIAVELGMVTWLIAQMLTKEHVPTAVVLWNGIVMLITLVMVTFAVRRERLRSERTQDPVQVHHEAKPEPNQAVLWSGLVAAFVFTGWVDIITGYLIDVAILYYIPIAFAAWRLSRSGAVIAIELGIVTWLIAQMLTKDNVSTGVVLWNGLVMLITFILIFVAIRRERLTPSPAALAYVGTMTRTL